MDPSIRPGLTLRALTAFVVCAVVGAGLTLLLWPLWSWVAALSGLQGLGTTWPVLVCYALTTAALLLVFFRWQGRR